jgi:hypothetical protein
MKTINVKSVDDYFSLPKNEREWFGFYIKPNHLPSELFTNNKGWDTFYEEIKKQYPIQWVFREWMFSLENPVYWFFKSKYLSFLDLKYSVQNFLKPSFPRWRKTLPRHKYSDISEVFVSSNFNLILDFYHEEVSEGYVDWEHDERHRTFHSTLVSYVKWIEEEKVEISNKMDNCLLAREFAEYNNLEEVMKKKESEILKWFVDNRDFFWT